MKVEFINFNNDPKLDPEIKPIPLSKDSKNMPPAYCLPWVEAAKYSIQLKANHDYVIMQQGGKIETWVEKEGKRIPQAHLEVEVPDGTHFVPKNTEEAMGKKIEFSESPNFSSPWQVTRGHSVTLKLGISWWMSEGWGLFINSAIHRNNEFRVVEGYVRTDLWHRDIPIVIQPLVVELRIPKYSIIASCIPVKAEGIELVDVSQDEAKKAEHLHQISLKRLRPSIYKEILEAK